MGNSVYIVSADAKDLFLANYSNYNCAGYSIRFGSGEINTRRFINTLDYSLDLIKLREVYEKVYRRSDFTFWKRGKEYCERVINVTFHYSVKAFNRFFDKIYVKYGYLPADVALTDNICLKDGELVAIRTDAPVENPAPASVLGKLFAYEDGVYKQKKSIPVVMTVAQLRERLYHDGFVCDGMQFRRFKRSAGSSRVGKCLFIDEKLYPRMHKWELCGLKVKDGQEIDLAALEAYIALTLSSIVGTIQLQPENFLVIDDYKSGFQNRVIAVRADQDGWLVSQAEDVEIENSIWDGQSLIEKDAMGSFSQYGMILLRNRFFKSACFNTNIQEFFKANGITEVSQLNGFTLAEKIEDIKVITTPSSIKYAKFGSLEAWLRLLAEDGSFGVVKHEKPTHFFDGRMVQIHYQLLNTLQMTQQDVDALVEPSLEYLRMIREDPAVLRYHIHHSADPAALEPAETTNDVVYQMLGATDKFAQTKLYYNFMKDTLRSFKGALRCGHILVNGNYSTLLGNPMEMLLSAIRKFDGTSQIGTGRIYSKRFQFHQTILGSRSPHVTMGNILLVQNCENADVEQYFNLTEEIVCVNSIGENTLMRLSGADFDSDTVLLTDNPILIRAAKKNYERFFVPTSLIEAKKMVRHYTQDEQADLDIKTSVNKIGEIVNLSQELNTRLWHEVNNGSPFESIEELYCDIAKLDVLSGTEIDKAKKEFVVDSAAEIKKLRQKYGLRDDSGRQIKPNFFGKIARTKGYYDSARKNYRFHDTTMDYLQHSINGFRERYGKHDFTPFSDLMLPKETYNTHGVVYKQVDAIIALVRNMRSDVKKIFERYGEDDRYWCSRKIAEIREEYRDEIAHFKLNRNTAYRLLLAIEEPWNKDISRTLFMMLFSVPNYDFMSLMEQSREPIPVLVEDTDNAGSIHIYDFSFRKEWIIPPCLCEQIS